MNVRHALRKITGRKHNIRLKRYLLNQKRLGSGKSGKVHEEKLEVTWGGKKRVRPVAVKRFHSRHYDDYGALIKSSTPEQKRARLIRTRRLWKELRAAGLPLPEIYRPILRKNSKEYLSLIMEQLEHKHGKLIQGHEMQHGRPVLFNELSLKKDSELIRSIAQDIATVHNLGYSFSYPDLWAYYKKGNTYGRVIIDLDDVRKVDSTKKIEMNEHLFSLIEGELGTAEMDFFIKEYTKKLTRKK